MTIGTETRIRSAVVEDLPRLKAVVEAAYWPYVARIGKKPAPMLADYAALIAGGSVQVLVYADDIVAGLVMMPGPSRDSPNHLFIENLVVDPAFQGRGFGRLLMAHACEAARRDGLPCVRLYTNAAMVESLEFYKCLGFIAEDRRHEAGYDRIFLVKELT